MGDTPRDHRHQQEHRANEGLHSARQAPPDSERYRNQPAGCQYDRTPEANNSAREPVHYGKQARPDRGHGGNGAAPDRWHAGDHHPDDRASDAPQQRKASVGGAPYARGQTNPNRSYTHNERATRGRNPNRAGPYHPSSSGPGGPDEKTADTEHQSHESSPRCPNICDENTCN